MAIKQKIVMTEMSMGLAIATVVIVLIDLVLLVSTYKDFTLKRNLIKGSERVVAEQYDAAIQALTRAKNARPEYPNTYLVMGKVLSENSTVLTNNSAAEMYDEALRINPHDHFALLGFGMQSLTAYFQENQELNAEELLSQLDMLREDFIGFALEENGDSFDAKILYQYFNAEKIFLRTHQSLWYKNELWVKNSKGRPDKGRTRGVKNTIPDIRLALEEILIQLETSDQIETKDLPVTETLVLAHNTLGYLYVLEGDLKRSSKRVSLYAKAIKEFRKATSYRLPFPTPAINLFHTYGRILGDRSLSSRQFSRTLLAYENAQKEFSSREVFSQEIQQQFRPAIYNSTVSAAKGLFVKALRNKSDLKKAMNDLVSCYTLMQKAISLSSREKSFILELQVARVIREMFVIQKLGGPAPLSYPGKTRPWNRSDVDLLLQRIQTQITSASVTDKFIFHLVLADFYTESIDLPRAEKSLKILESMSAPGKLIIEYYRTRAIFYDIYHGLDRDDAQAALHLEEAIEFYKSYLELAQNTPRRAQDVELVKARLNELEGE